MGILHMQLANLVSILNEEPVGCLSKARRVVEVTQIAPQVGIVNNAFLIALYGPKKKNKKKNRTRNV